MNVVGKVGSLISQGVYSVATPFHPFGGAVDIIVVQQQDGTFRTTPWYVRFGKFQGVLKGAEKMVRISVNGVEADFHMYLDNSGEAYFVKEVGSGEGSELKDSEMLGSTCSSVNDNTSVKSEKENGNICEPEESVCDNDVQLQEGRVSVDGGRLERTESDSGRRFYEFQDEQSSLEGLSDYGSGRYENLDGLENYVESQVLSSEVILVSIDGHILTAPISSLETNTENVQLSTPQFHLGPGEGPDLVEDNAGFSTGEEVWAADYLSDLSTPAPEVASGENGSVTNDSDPNGNQQEVSSGGQDQLHLVQDNETVSDQQEELCGDGNSRGGIRREDVFKSCLELPALALHNEDANSQAENSPSENHENANGLHETFQDNDLQPADRTGNGNLDQSKSIDGNQTLSNSCSPTAIVSPDLQVEVEHGDNKESEELVDKVRESNGGYCSPQRPALEPQETSISDNTKTNSRIEISLCGNLLQAGMGLNAAREVFDDHRISEEAFKLSAASITKNENLVIRFQDRYIPWDKAAPIVLGMAAYSLELTVELKDAIPVEKDETPRPGEDGSGLASTPSGRRWRLWPIPFRRVKTLEHTNSSASSEEVFVDSESGSLNHIEPTPSTPGGTETPRKQLRRTNVPTTEQISSLNLKEGQNLVTFSYSTRVWGLQQVDAHIYLWKWNARIVISDVDGTITKSDVLGQFMPLVGKDWTQSGVARLFSAIKENGYQLLFLSARAIVQAYLTRSYLINLKQDGKALPTGPVVISPDGLFPSLYREVIRRAPHEFKIACLEDIKALFPPDYNPFYAGFGNRDTDELSYRKIGIPKGKIFIINPKGEVAISHRIDVKSYTSLHTLVNDMFPPTSMVEQEDFNSWNYWRMPLPDVE